MPIAKPEQADYHLDGNVETDTPEEYAQKTYAFFLHEIAKQHDAEDDGNVLLDDFLRTTMVLARVQRLIEDHDFIRLRHYAEALLWHHEAYDNNEDNPDDLEDLQTVEDMLK